LAVGWRADLIVFITAFALVLKNRFCANWVCAEAVWFLQKFQFFPGKKVWRDCFLPEKTAAVPGQDTARNMIKSLAIAFLIFLCYGHR